MGDIKTLLPGESAKVGEETVILRPFLFGDLPEILRIINEIGADLLVLVSNLKTDEETDEVIIDASLVAGISDLFCSQFDNVASIVSLSTGKPVEWVKGLPLDSGIELLIGTIMQNIDFFAARLPALKEKVSQAMKAAKTPKRKPPTKRNGAK